ncbi:MAG: hypothetical protein V4581_07135 [Bacteroidota bacterium]
MKTLNSIIYLATIAILGITLSCGGSGTAVSQENNATMGNASEVRTSSDMNISPANMMAQDPMYRKNDTLIPVKDSVAPNTPND